MDISGNIRQLLQEQKRPASWLAEKIGVTRGGLSKMLDSGVFRSDTLEAIAKTLDVPIATLFGGAAGEGGTADTVQTSIRAMNQSITDFAQVILWLSGLADRYPEKLGAELLDYIKKFQNPMARMLVALGNLSNSQAFPLPVKKDFIEVMEAAVEKNISEIQTHKKRAKKS